ncbi:MAG: hypothetical protein FD124_165 [Alphaproteobacteria bacterium]|nr:MAG: hypothetical protein FD160_1195 [Caulobacteraceae bacterium]TPW08779.1 MAG: hypothetical protein FD124_165 [Alphaproteobacteria bacterium]
MNSATGAGLLATRVAGIGGLAQSPGLDAGLVGDPSRRSAQGGIFSAERAPMGAGGEGRRAGGHLTPQPDFHDFPNPPADSSREGGWIGIPRFTVELN